MIEEGKRQYPNEACGLILKVGGKSRAIVCKNTSAEPSSRFRIAAEEYADACRQGEVVGVWHTHTDEDAQPSEADRAACEAGGIPWYIVGISKEGEEFVVHGPVGIAPNGYRTPYLARPYVYGVHDCHTLLCDYYEWEYGIALKRDRPRIDEWWAKGYNFFSKPYFEEDGFVELIDQEPKEGDVFLLQMGSVVPSHIVIYLGNDMILHHCIGRLSTRDVFGGYWAKHAVHHLRHNSKC